jgi:hypothetical protein
MIFWVHHTMSFSKTDGGLAIGELDGHLAEWVAGRNPTHDWVVPTILIALKLKEPLSSFLYVFNGDARELAIWKGGATSKSDVEKSNWFQMRFSNSGS